MKTLFALPFLLVASIASAQTINSSSPLPNGTQGQDYAVTLTCSNCEGYNYELVTPPLPPGLSLSPTGTISGIPSSTGTYTFQIGLVPIESSFQATPVGTKTFSITIPSSLTILSTTFPAGSLNVIYPTQTLSASGGVTPYTWSITAGALPPGMGILNGNSIGGTPTAVGTYSFTLNVADSAQHGAFVQTSIVVGTSSTSTAAITTTSLPAGTVNAAYAAQLTCANCSGYTWSLSSGVSPLGLTLGAGGGITGTPTAAGSYSFQVTLTPPESYGIYASSVSQILSITINAAPLGIVQSTLPTAFQGASYSTTLTASGGLPPYTWSLQSTGNDGLTIGSGNGVISGTPSATGTFVLTVYLTDSSGLSLTKNFTLTAVASLSILTTSLPNGSVGTVYPLQTLTAGGGQPPYRWSIPSGSLPPGLTLDGVFGRISGTPTSNGAYPFTLMVTDNQANTASASLSITIGSTITITPSTLPAGISGTAYSQTLTASGGKSPYTWSVASGALPAGLTLGATTGVISGTPTALGTANFTVQATDSAQLTGQQGLSIQILAPPLSITTASLPNGTVNTAYSQTLAATGGVPPYTWSLASGALPAGLMLNSSSGAVSGTPTAAATSSITVQVADSAKNTAQKALSLTVVVTVSPLTVTAAALPAGTVGVAYSQSPLTVSGGTKPYAYAFSSASDGLTINLTTGAISGTPAAAGTFTLTVVVTDTSSPQQQQSVNLPFTVNPSTPTLTVTAAALPAGTVGVAYSQSPLTVSGGTKPYSYALTSTSKDGLTISSTSGAISGMPTSSGTVTLAVVVTDSSTPAQTATQSLSLTVNPAAAPTITLGFPATSGFQQQLVGTPTLSSRYPTAINGTIVLTFTPSVTPPAGSTGTIDDAMIQFSGGSGRTITFTIPAGSTTPSSPSTITVLTGTTAGTITLTTTLTSNGAQLGTPTVQTIVDAAGVPFISKVTLQQASGGLTVVITGFSSTRDMLNASFAFAPATGDTFTSDNVSVPVQGPFTTWWANTAQSNPFGTEFTLTVPFTLATATQSVTNVVVVSVTVTLQNSKGASNPVTLSQ